MAEIKSYDQRSAIGLGAAAAVTQGLLYGIDSNGKAVVSDRRTGPKVAVGFAVTSLTTAQASAGKQVALARIGVVECAAADIAGSSFTVGGTVYLDVSGKYTTTKPTTAADIIQVIGVAMSATKVAVNVVPASLTLQAAGTTTIAP